MMAYHGGDIRPTDEGPQPFAMPSEEFRKELAILINRHSLENAGGRTPDFILADYLCSCIMAYGATVRSRDSWWGRPEECAK